MDQKWRDWYETQALPSEDVAKVGLLAADTDRTQDYVFESAKLPEIRGASNQLDELNQSLGDMVKAKDGYLIYAGGGGLLALTSLDAAKDLAAEIEALYPRKTTVATITADWRPVTPEMIDKGYPPNDAAPFGALVRWAGTWLRRLKESRDTLPFVEALPQTERCLSCLTRPANPRYLQANSDWPLCDVCQAKRVYPKRGLWFQRFKENLAKDSKQHQLYDQSSPPHDLGEIGRASAARSGYVGFVYLDGDGMGQIFEQVPTPEAYAKLSQTIEDAAEEAVMNSLATLFPPQVESSPERKTSGQKIRIYPFEIITIGGDDIMLIAPADVALPLAAQISQKFERSMRQRLAEVNLPDSLKKRAYTMSGGVVLASAHNPVRVLRDLSKELQREAKKARKLAGAQESYIDFVTLKSADMLDRSVRGIRDLYPYTLHGVEMAPLRLLGRPYSASTLTKLWTELADLRTQGFPLSQMHLLGEALLRGRQESSLFYLYQAARDKGNHFQSLTRIIQLAQGSDDSQHPLPWFDLVSEEGQRFSYKTVLWDIVELYDFVPTGKGASG